MSQETPYPAAEAKVRALSGVIGGRVTHIIGSITTSVAEPAAGAEQIGQRSSRSSAVTTATARPLSRRSELGLKQGNGVTQLAVLGPQHRLSAG